MTAITAGNICIVTRHSASEEKRKGGPKLSSESLLGETRSCSKQSSDKDFHGIVNTCRLTHRRTQSVAREELQAAISGVL